MVSESGTSPQPLVALIVINFNYDRFLPDCLRSIDAQLYENIHVIVVDDASTDDSRTTISRWAQNCQYPHTLILKNRNRGPAHSINSALDALPGEAKYVALIDADDYWFPNKAIDQVRLCEGLAEDVTVAYSTIVHVGQFDGYEATTERTREHVFPVKQSPPSITLVDLLQHGSRISLNSALIRASSLRRIGRLDEKMRLCDYQLWLLLAQHGDFVRVDTGPVGAVRGHLGSMTHTESTNGDRLLLLGRAGRTPTQRRAARARGRRLLGSASVSRDRTRSRTYWEYGLGARDVVALPAWIVSYPASGRRMLKALRSLVRRDGFAPR